MGKPRKYKIDPEWEAVLRADPCAYCGAPTRDLDHIVPIVREGGDDWANLTASCGRCNKEKYEQSLLVFLWKRSLETEPTPQSPRAGVHWRKDIKRWTAFVDLVRRRQLGHFATPEEAVAAVEAWWATNPDAMSPRARRKQEREQAIRELWSQNLTMREIAERLGMTHNAVVAFIRRSRESGEGIAPRVGRGGAGKPRPKRPVKSKSYGQGYRFSQHTTRPWLVQVQSGGERLIRRFQTEEEARRAVALFREAYKA